MIFRREKINKRLKQPSFGGQLNIKDMRSDDSIKISMRRVKCFKKKKKKKKGEKKKNKSMKQSE